MKFFFLSIKCSKFSTLCILTSLAGFENHSKHSSLALAVSWPVLPASKAVQNSNLALAVSGPVSPASKAVQNTAIQHSLYLDQSYWLQKAVLNTAVQHLLHLNQSYRLWKAVLNTAVQHLLHLDQSSPAFKAVLGNKLALSQHEVFDESWLRQVEGLEQRPAWQEPLLAEVQQVPLLQDHCGGEAHLILENVQAPLQLPRLHAGHMGLPGQHVLQLLLGAPEPVHQELTFAGPASKSLSVLHPLCETSAEGRVRADHDVRNTGQLEHTSITNAP